MEKLFAELNGFAIYEPAMLVNYLKENRLRKKDVLSYFYTSNHGDLITRQGIALPIVNLDPDDYGFEILDAEPPNYLVRSGGWIFHAPAGLVRIIGIGYLTNLSSIKDDTGLRFTIAEGWHKLTIYSYWNEEEEPCFGLHFQPAGQQPDFSGDFDTDYAFE